ncbi:hypothetical protein HMPREF1505_0506 [Prevotella sp. ICM33]|nr:hypothetical protein HMPREF1505_0506 [Prevotella sp. ICM33]
MILPSALYSTIGTLLPTFALAAELSSRQGTSKTNSRITLVSSSMLVVSISDICFSFRSVVTCSLLYVCLTLSIATDFFVRQPTHIVTRTQINSLQDVFIDLFILFRFR